jgi:hypothetical protein
MQEKQSLQFVCFLVHYDGKIRRRGWGASTGPRLQRMRISVRDVVNRPGICCGARIKRALGALVGGKIADACAWLCACRAGARTIRKRAEAHAGRTIERRGRAALGGSRNRIEPFAVVLHVKCEVVTSARCRGWIAVGWRK